MFCSSCGQNIPEDAKFCKYCGTAIHTGSETDANRGNVPASTPSLVPQGPITADSATTSKGGPPSSLFRRPIVIALSILVLLAGASVAIVLGHKTAATVSTSITRFENSIYGTRFRVDVRNTSKASVTESCVVAINLLPLSKSVTSVLPNGGGPDLNVANFQTSIIRVKRTFTVNYLLPMGYESWLTKKSLSVACENVNSTSVRERISNSIVTSFSGGDSAAESAVINEIVNLGNIERSQITRVSLSITLSRDWLNYAIINTVTDTGTGVLHWTGSGWVIATGPGTYDTDCPLPASIEKTVFDAPPCPS